jgi:hypothetical protein
MAGLVGRVDFGRRTHDSSKRQVNIKAPSPSNSVNIVEHANGESQPRGRRTSPPPQKSPKNRKNSQNTRAAHLSVNTPPSKGPTTLASAKTPPKEPKRSGRCSRRVTCDRMVRMEMKMPEAPTPWNARP